MTKYKFHNENMPSLNSLLMYRFIKDGKEFNTICIVEDIIGDQILSLRLDSNLKCVIGKDDNWIKLNIYDLKNLRNAYNYIILNVKDNGLPDEVNNTKGNENKILQLVRSSYKDFENKYKKMKK